MAARDLLKKAVAVSPLKITFAVILTALLVFFMDPAIIRFMELKTLDMRMVSRGQIAPTGEVVIATVDEKSLDEIGRWPWSRTVLARLVDTLKGYGARAVGFDIVFSEPDENASLKTLKELSAEFGKLGVADSRVGSLIAAKRKTADTDAALAAAVERGQNVTLGYFFHASARDVAHYTPDEIAKAEEVVANGRYPIVQTSGKVEDYNIIRAFAPVPTLKEISAGAVNCGYFNAFPDPDGVIRWAPLVIKFGENYYYSLALAVLLQYAGMPPAMLALTDYGVAGIQVGDVTIPVDESGRILINYLGPGKTFTHYSIADILKGRLAPETFKDKIVIVGATATGIYDLRVTPFGTVYPGVEIHANVVDNILTGNFLEHSAWITFLDVCSIVFFGLLMGILVPRVNAVYGIAVSTVLIGVFAAANTLAFIHYKLWLNMVYPIATMMTVYLMITVYRYITEEREKKKIRGAFQYYLNPAVISNILQDPGKLKLGGDKKDLTVMFSDIRGFTTISERLTPEELVKLLNEYLTAMTAKVFKYDGLLDKYIGDAIMAVFGAPVEQPDHADRACRTALDMMAELKVFQEKMEREGHPRIDIGIGINTGDMVVGNMGSDMRFDYTVMGDNVNLSSRLEGINKEYGTHIIASENTYERVKERFAFREVDAVRVKGKKLPVKIYELLGEKGDEVAHAPYVLPFEEGLARYREGKWEEAIAQFRKALEANPQDATSKIYIERSEMLKEHPPEAGTWDGVFTMTKK